MEYSEIPLKATQCKDDNDKKPKNKEDGFLNLFDTPGELLLKGPFSAVLRKCLTKWGLLTATEYDT